MLSQNYKSTFSKTCTGWACYGFNGKEKDDEWSGTTGADYNYDARIYDSRIGRFLSIDPLVKRYPNGSPYSGFNDNPIIFNDPSGKGGVVTITGGLISPNSLNVNISSTMYLYQTGDTKLDIQSALDNLAGAQKVEKDNEGFYTFTAIRTQTMKLGGASSDVKTFSVTYKYSVKIKVVTSDEAKTEIEKNNPAINCYEVKGNLYSKGHTDENTGMLDLNGLNDLTQVGIKSPRGLKLIFHELWHGMVGGEHKTNSMRTLSTNGDINLTETDIQDLINKMNVNPKSSTEVKNVTVGGAKSHLMTNEEYNNSQVNEEGKKMDVSGTDTDPNKNKK
jgi:RHS repeat-associated protein